MFVHTVKDTVEDAFTTAAGGKGAHGADAPTHFDEEPFNDISCAQTFPVGFRTTEEGEEFFQVGLQTGDGLGRLLAPAPFPLAEAIEGFCAMWGLIDELGLLQAGLLRGFEFVG